MEKELTKTQWKKTIPVDQVSIEERVEKLSHRSIKKDSKIHALKMALSMIDLTTLEGMDTEGKVIQLCRKAKEPYIFHPDLPTVAAVCVYPTMIKTAKRELEGTGVKVAGVATAFPSGMTSLQVKLEEATLAVEDGADEVDMVISRGAFLRGEYQYAYDEIAAVKEACGNAHLKVILETGELQTYENVRKASDIAMEAGADFIKTSTGKVQPAATQPVTLVMLEAIRDYFYKTDRMVGMKPAGGIRKAKQALQYLVLVRETLGAAWLTTDYFRIGASSLLNDILMQIVKQETGVYQGPDYFSND